MARTLPRVTKDVLTLIGNADAAVQRGNLSYARTLANALHDAGFYSAAAGIEREDRRGRAARRGSLGEGMRDPQL